MQIGSALFAFSPGWQTPLDQRGFALIGACSEARCSLHGLWLLGQAPRKRKRTWVRKRLAELRNLIRTCVYFSLAASCPSPGLVYLLLLCSSRGVCEVTLGAHSEAEPRQPLLQLGAESSFEHLSAVHRPAISPRSLMVRDSAENKAAFSFMQEMVLFLVTFPIRPGLKSQLLPRGWVCLLLLLS